MYVWGRGQQLDCHHKKATTCLLKHFVDKNHSHALPFGTLNLKENPGQAFSLLLIN